jgi:hypothetical protein
MENSMHCLLGNLDHEGPNHGGDFLFLWHSFRNSRHGKRCELARQSKLLIVPDENLTKTSRNAVKIVTGHEESDGSD